MHRSEKLKMKATGVHRDSILHLIALSLVEEPDCNGCHLKGGVPILLAFLGGGVVSEPG